MGSSFYVRFEKATGILQVSILNCGLILIFNKSRERIYFHKYIADVMVFSGNRNILNLFIRVRDIVCVCEFLASKLLKRLS